MLVRTIEQTNKIFHSMRCVVKVLSVGMTVCDVLISPVPDNVMELVLSLIDAAETRHE